MLPVWAATAGATALQNPAVQSALVGAGQAGLGVLGSGLRGLGRGMAYVGEGFTGNVAQPMFNKMGDLGNQYLPASVSNIGRGARQGMYGLGQSTFGSQQGQGMWDKLLGRNLPQGQQGGMGGMQGMQGMQGPGQQGGMGALQGLGQQGGMQGMQGMGMDPHRQMQQNYMQGMQQEYMPMDQARQQQMINQYQQNHLPQLAASYGAREGGRSGSYLRSLAGGEADLRTNLAALGEGSRENAYNMNQGRFNNMGQYLGNQQQLGLGARRLGLDQTIDQRNHGMRMMGLMGNHAQAQQNDYMQQLVNAINAQGGMGNIAMGQAFQPTNIAQGRSVAGQVFPAAANAATEAAKVAAKAYVGGV